MVSDVEKVAKCSDIYNVFNFRGIFFTNKITLYACWESLAYTINIMLCYLFLHVFYIMENWKLCNPLLVVYDVYEKTASYVDIK